jgi:predicted Fe-Mo cluster-binding NifX family protein
MKIVVANDSGYVASHFGRSEVFTVIDTEDDRIINRRDVPNSGHDAGCLPRIFEDQQISVVITGGLGERARSRLSERNIQLITGIRGRVDDAIDKYFRGELSSLEEICDHDHGRPHQGSCRCRGEASE